jgi:hypothetical protein
MPTRAWFPTFIYCEPLQKTGRARPNAGLADDCRCRREFDAIGQRWFAKIHVPYPTDAVNVILSAGWLRHELAANRVADAWISISSNFNWA